jgi:hypothetical protein
MVKAVTDSGIPAKRAPTRATLSVLQDSRQQPNRTSSMIDGSIPARLMASFMTTAAILAPITFFKVPPNVPIAVLHAETITTSFIVQTPYRYDYFLL